MSDVIETIEELHNKANIILKEFNSLPEKDIRKTHLEILSSEIATSLITLKINKRFSETNEQEFKDFFNSDEQQIDNYLHNFIQHTAESIVDSALFQTELIFRFYYSKLTGKTPGEERSLHKIIAALYQDTDNAWTKEEAKLIILFWTLRNTIHTGGIYFHKTAGFSLSYKGSVYKFEYGKTPDALRNGNFIVMISDLFDSLRYLFNSPLIQGLGNFDHPSYHALGY